MMYLERKEDLSVYFLVKTLFRSNPEIKIVDGFPDEALTIPSVAVDNDVLALEDFELGNREGRRTRTWYIDVFAKNKTQRDDFCYRILNGFKNGIVVYDYDEGFPDDSSPSKIGHLGVIMRRMRPLKINPKLVDKMYYRATVTIVASNTI